MRGVDTRGQGIVSEKSSYTVAEEANLKQKYEKRHEFREFSQVNLCKMSKTRVLAVEYEATCRVRLLLTFISLTYSC